MSTEVKSKEVVSIQAVGAAGEYWIIPHDLLLISELDDNIVAIWIIKR